MLQCELEAISKAVNAIQQGMFNRVSLGTNTTVYKVPSNNPDKYTIRIDIKVAKEG